MNILGISGSTHDSAACIVRDGEVITLIEEERISRRKHASYSLPINAAREAMKVARVNQDEIDLVSYFLDPELFNSQVKGHVLYGDWKRYLLHPISYNTQGFLRRGKRYDADLKSLLGEIGVKAKIEYVEHHLAHAASAYYPSGFNEATIMTLDNMGELDSTLIAEGKGNNIRVLSRQRIPHSLGMFYAAITDYLGFRAWDEEGKVMALAAYGKPSIPLEEMVEFGNGSFRIKEDFQMAQTISRDRMYAIGLVKRFGTPRKRGEPLTQRHMDIAASAQYAIEEVAKHLATWAYNKTRISNLCLAGGVALNCKMNGELAKLPFIDKIYVTPVAGDAGSGFGAALYSSVQHQNIRSSPISHAYLGRQFDNSAIEDALKKEGVSYRKLENAIEEAANRLLLEKAIAFYRGRSEIGPRALGNRSILALPQSKDTRDYINSKVKGRELWRPLCPSIVVEESNRYFDNSSRSKFMNISFNASRFAISRVSAAIHIDGSVRVQSVDRANSPAYYALLTLVGDLAGDPVLINTSFNCRGEPIVDSPADAVRSFMNMPLKSLIIGDYLVSK